MHTLHFYNTAWENLPISFLEIDCFDKMYHGNTFFFYYFIDLYYIFSISFVLLPFLNILSWKRLTNLIQIEKV